MALGPRSHLRGTGSGAPVLCRTRPRRHCEHRRDRLGRRLCAPRPRRPAVGGTVLLPRRANPGRDGCGPQTSSGEAAVRSHWRPDSTHQHAVPALRRSPGRHCELRAVGESAGIHPALAWRPACRGVHECHAHRPRRSRNAAVVGADFQHCGSGPCGRPGDRCPGIGAWLSAQRSATAAGIHQYATRRASLSRHSFGDRRNP